MAYLCSYRNALIEMADRCLYRTALLLNWRIGVCTETR
jgi:hypothetical protein